MTSVYKRVHAHIRASYSRSSPHTAVRKIQWDAVWFAVPHQHRKKIVCAQKSALPHDLVQSGCPHVGKQNGLTCLYALSSKEL